jgi:exonuclease III
MEKLVAIMRRKSDIIIITDCRLRRGVEKIRKIFRVGKGAQYNFIANSSRSERGVCIAVNRGRDIEVLNEERDLLEENYLLLKCRLEGRDLLVGGVYGPNTNNVAFYVNLRTRIESYGIPFIIGGDFNTVISGAQGEENLDLEDRLNIPNKDNGKFIREWIDGGEICDPFRKKYPMSRSMSYVPFRTRKKVNNAWVENNYGKSRLDFYLISNSLFNSVDSIFYGDRISRDMDHLEAVLRLGKSTRTKESLMIRNCT